MSSLYERYKKKTEYTRKLEEENKKKYKEQEDMEALISKTREVGRAREEAFQAPSQRLMNKKKQQQEFLESDDNVGFWDGMLPGGATPSEWNESRKKKKQYQKEVDQAAAEVAAYEQFKRQKEFERNVDRMTSEDIDKYLAETDRQIEDINDEGGFFSAIAPGGITPSKYLENRDRKNAIEAEQGRYRAVRDEKKSREMTENLPENVLKLLDEYNASVGEYEGYMFTPQPSDVNQYQQDLMDIAGRKAKVKEELLSLGYDNFEELAAYRKYITDKEYAEKQIESMTTGTEKHPVLSSVANFVLSPVRMVSGALGTIRNLDDASDLQFNPYTPYHFFSYNNDAKKGAIENSFEDGVISADVKKFLYNTVESGAESYMMGTLLGPAAGAFLGADVMSTTVIDTIEKGGTKEQALISGLFAGTFEGLFEGLSIGQLKYFKDVPVSGVKDVLRNIASGAAVNFSEEALTETANIITDYMVNGGISDYYSAVQYYMDMGYGEEEAKKKASVDMGGQIWQAGLGGALMGGAFGSIGSAQSATAYNSAMKDLGQRVVEDDAVESQLASAAELGVNKEDAIYKFVQQTEAYQNKKTQNESYKASKRDLRSIGKLTEGLDLRASDKINAESLESIGNRLKELGESENTDFVAKTIQKVIRNRTASDSQSTVKLSKREKAALQNSKAAQRVISELEGSKYVKHDSAWVEQLNRRTGDIAKSRRNPDIEGYRNRNSSDSHEESKVQNTKVETSAEEAAPYGFDNYENRVKGSIINEGQDRERFDSDFELFKQYGEAGRNFEEVKNNSTVSENFTEIQKQAAFDLGREMAEAQKITVVKEIKGKDSEGEAIVADIKGQEHKLSEINTDSTTRSLISNASKYDIPTSNVFIQGYNRSASVSSYTRAFDAFYSAGAASADTTFSEAMKKYGELTKYMADKDVAKKAFDKGRAERTKTDKAVKQKKQTGEHPAKGTYQSKTVSVGEEAVDEFYSALAKKTVIDIDRVPSIVNRNGQEKNAQYDPTRNKMTTSATAENELQASIHELVHYAFAYNTEKMKPVKKAVIDYSLSQNSESEFEELLRQYGASYEGDSRADIEEEFVADALGGMFTTKEGVQDFLNWLQEESGYNANEKKTILQRITEWLNDIIEAIRDIMNSGELNGAGKFFAKENCDELMKIRKMFLEALDGATVNYREGGAVEGDVRFSFKNTKTGMANDKLLPYDEELTAIIEQKGGYIVDSFDKLKNIVNIAYDNPQLKATAYFGIVSPDVLSNIENHIHNLPKELEGKLFKQGQSYSVAATLDSIKHLSDEKALTKQDVIDYLDRMSDTIIDFDSVNFDYYYQGKEKSKGIVFKKTFADGTMQSFEIVSNKKRSLNLQTIYMQKGDYKKKKSAETLLMGKPSADAQGAGRSNFSNSIPDSSENVKNSLTVNIDKSEKLSDLEAEKKKYDDEIFLLRRDFDKIKRTDEYERLETAVVEARGNDEAFNAAIDEYNKWLKESGMGEINRKLTEAKAKQGELRKEIVRLQNDLHKDFMKSIERFDDETVSKYVSKAVRKFKTTNNLKLAGYLTTTGSLLDFSDGQGYRVQDHREIKNVLDLPDYAEYSDGMIAFMNMGNIRLQSYGIDISKMPNTKQISVLRRFFNSLNGEVVVDFSQPDGHSAGSIEYPENTKADRILNDIKKYFDTGVVPELSDVQRFRYSLPLSNLNDLHQSNIEKVTELSRVAAQLTAHINYIGSSQTKRTLSTLNIQTVARELKKEYQSKADIHEITAALEEIYNKFEEGRVSGEVVKAHVDSIVDKIINESVYMKPDISDYAKEILSELRSVKIKLSDVQKQQAAYHFGSYNEFRKALMGSVVLSEEGTPLDERWQSLCGMFPGRFDSETVDTDQPYALFEAIKELRNTYDDESGLDIDSVKVQLSADICAGYISIPTVAQYSNQYSVLEQELLQSLKAEKQMYKQIYYESYNRAKARYNVQLANVKADQAEEILRAKARMNQRVENIADTRLREKKRNRLIKTIKRLDRLLRNPGKGAPSAGTNKYGQDYVHLTNIPEGLKKTVIDFCSIFVDNDAGVFTGKFTDSENVVRKKINELRKQYQSLKKSDAYISTVVSDEMAEKLETMHEIVADKRLAQLTASELDTLNEIADHLITVINNEVEMWVNGKKTKVNDIGKAVLNEQNSKGMKGYIQAMKGIDKISVMNLKPIYFFEKVGGTLQKLWNDILGGQDRYVRNMQYAQQRFSDISKKYNLDSWIDDDAKTFKTEQGHEISLTRGQALLVWATWKREGIAGKDSKHLFEGGIVFPDAVEKASDKGKNKLPKVLQKVYEDGTAHRIRVEDMLKIDEWLTKEQKAYADELVSFLSNDVAGWGNEISMQLYGINKFNEKYYIPFNSAGNYLYKGMGDEGTKLLKSEGFTKETQWGANNPLVVDDFTQVVVKHIERMSMYNSMVIPLDNFSRVWNYQERADADSNDSTQNVKAAFETAWGKEYKKYVENLLRDINGGVMSDSREIGDKWISKFKKAAVMGSASVMIQQPSAIVRAFSEVDTRYFVASTFGQRKAAYEEAKKYAPVAVLKEIGGFDTVGGQSMTDWMLKRDYKGKDKLIAFFKDSQFRDDVISWGPAWADRVTWAHIWLACKKEVQHKGYEGKKGLTGEALLEATGKRFTEVINKTQVYDSVLSRSDAMRSKSTLMKMQTAFMAEPVTQWNMYGSAVRDFKKGDRKKAFRKVGSVIGAQLFNSMLVSIIYAARDDDEEKSQWEKYLGEVVGNFLDSLNPLTLVPFFKDMISLAQGYDVERTDVSVFSNVIDSITDMFNENMSWQDKALGLAGAGFDVFGFPFKNLVRDGKALWNTAKSLSGEQNTTSGGILASIRDEMFPILKNLGIVSDKKGTLLYDAFVSGNSSLYAEYASRYKDGKAVKNALTTQIKDRYIKGSMTEDEATELLSRLGYSENDVYYKLREWDTPEEEETEESPDENEAFFSLEGIDGLSSEAEEDNKGSVSYTYLHDAIAKGDTALIKSEIEDLLNRGAEEDDIKRSVMSKWGKAYRESTDPNERKKIEQTIASTGLWTTGEVFAMTKRWREKAEQDSRK